MPHTTVIIQGEDYHTPNVDRKGLKWTPLEVEYLTQHYPDDNTYDISEYLGRSYKTVCAKALKLKLNKIKKTKIVEYRAPDRGNKSYGVLDRIRERQVKGGFL